MPKRTTDLEAKPRRCTRAFGTHRAFSSETRSIQATALAEAVTVGSPVVLLLTKLTARGPRRQRRQYPTKQEELTCTASAISSGHDDPRCFDGVAHEP